MKYELFKSGRLSIIVVLRTLIHFRRSFKTADIELIDIFILILPVLFFNIIFSLKNNFNFKILKSRYPLAFLSYAFLITTSIFVMLVIIHIHLIHNHIVFHVHNFHSDVITDIASLELDFIAMLIVGWCLSMLYSSVLISQFALRLLNKYLTEESTEAQDFIETLPPATKSYLEVHNIAVRITSTSEVGLVFSLSYLTPFKRRNFIYLNESMFLRYSDAELNAIVVHEIGHIINMDTIFFPVFNTLAKLMFFDPILKRINILYKNRIEEKADLFALQNITEPKDLAKAIVKCLNTKDFESEGSSHRNSAIVSFKGSNKKVLTARIEKIIHFKGEETLDIKKTMD